MPNLASQIRIAFCQHGLEHRLQLAGRAADDLQHLRGRGLLLQRLAQVVGALAQLVEQPRVLDGDDGLGGKGPKQRHLLIRKWINFGASKLNCSNRLSLA